jgi:hypothetical protein
MTEPFECNSLELRIAFHNAVSRFQDWTANVTEPKAKFCGRFCRISEICEGVASLSNLLPEAILSVLYKETKACDDVLALKLDETYRGAGRHLLRLIERRKDEIRQRKALKLQPHSYKSGHSMTVDLTRDEIWFLKASRGKARSHR